jgi:alginate O-acetyltransferase complex protein AlgI
VTLAQLLVFSAFAPIARVLARLGARQWLVLAGSVLAIYWLQPLTPIRYLDFWFPTAALALTVWTWAATRPAPGHSTAVRASQVPAASASTNDRRANLAIAVGLMRYLGPVCCLTPARPPSLLTVIAGLGGVAAITALLLRLPAAGRWLNLGVALLVALLLITKFEPVGRAASVGLRSLSGQAPDLAGAADLRWLGFSYLSFRLIHVLRDRVSGRLPDVSLREFVTYALFFPAYTAGPIDRVERFVKDDRQPFRLDSEVVLAGGSRIALGVFKKFVLADGLALLALNANNATQAITPFWMWMLLYAFAWRLFLDFSGYTDIAIGLGRFFGIKLPENFDRPYFRQNLTLFWNSWHISLAQWFRAYVFNPLTRALRGRPLPPAAIILTTQMVTMLLIGLWHGVTLNFVIWGAWHGLGLFVHNRWADFMKPRASLLDARPRLKRAADLAGVVLTFHYVVLGWVWFALPSPILALAVFRRLFGLGTTI